VEAVHVLIEINGGEHFFFIEVAGEKKLNKNAIDSRIGV